MRYSEAPLFHNPNPNLRISPPVPSCTRESQRVQDHHSESVDKES